MERRNTNAELKIERAAFVELVMGIRPNSLITLGAGSSCKPEILNAKAEFFFKRMHREAYGRNWHMRDSAESIVAIGFIEHLNSNMHMHVAARAPTPYARSALDGGAQVWGEIRRGGHYHYEGLKDPEAYGRYITKELWKEEVRASVFIFTRPDMRGPHRKIQ